MHFSGVSAATVALFGSSAMAHVVMRTPTPYSPQKVQVNPLDGTQYVFPCQGGTNAAYYQGAQATDVTAGGTTLVQFTGSAVHGGGSCQFSISYDEQPPADPSKWKVVHSIIGDCPAKAAGNLQSTGHDAQGRVDGPQCNNSDGVECMRQFNIPFPKGLKSGKAHFAWTWNNKIGNREFYMNCAPINIKGDGGDDSTYNSLPGLFLSNYKGYCTTVEGVFGYPNPGNSVDQNEPANPASKGTCPAPGSGGNGGGNGGSPSPAPSAASSAPAYAGAPSSAAPAPAYNSGAANNGGVFAPGAAAPAPNAPAAYTTLASVPAPASTSAPDTAAPGATTGETIDCPGQDGKIVCKNETQFGMCDRGKAVVQSCAAGTTCKDGTILATQQKRAYNHLHAHVRRRSSNL